MTYAEKLKHPLWQRKRTEILQRDSFCCQLCGDTETTLHVHHHYYVKDMMPWEYPDDALITYCEICHKIVEELKNTNYLVLSISKADDKMIPYSIALAKDQDTEELVILTYWFNFREKKVFLLMRMTRKNIDGLINILELGEKLKNG